MALAKTTNTLALAETTHLSQSAMLKRRKLIRPSAPSTHETHTIDHATRHFWPASTCVGSGLEESPMELVNGVDSPDPTVTDKAQLNGELVWPKE